MAKKRKRYTNEEKLTIVQQVSQPGHNITIVAHGHNLPPSTVQGWCKNKDELEKSSIENNGGDSKTTFMDKTPQLTVGLKAFCEQPVDCMGCYVCRALYRHTPYIRDLRAT